MTNIFHPKIRCHATQAYAAYSLMRDYIEIVHEVDLIFLTRVFPVYFVRCVLPVGRRQAASIKAADIGPIIKTIDCVKTGIKDRLQGTGHEAFYVDTEKSFTEVQEKIRRCKDLGSDLAEFVYDIIF